MKKSTKGTLVLIALGIIVVLLTVLAIALQPEGNILQWLVRATGMMGYIAIFLGIISSAYIRDLHRLFGRKFIWIHHVVSISGLVLISIHPIALAIDVASAGVFVPKFDSWRVFFELAGRPALYLLLIATLAAVLRKQWRKNWRTIHTLNYVAFLLGTVHSVLIGTDFSVRFVQLIPISLAFIVVAVFIRKRVGMRRKKSRKQ